MPTALLVTADLGGNLPPFIGIGRALAARGWAVHLLGDASLAPMATHEGFRLHVCSSERYDPLLPRSTPVALRDITRLFASRVWGRDAVAAARRTSADVVVVDVLLIGAVAECEAAGLRTVVLAHTLVRHVLRTFGPGPIGAALRLRGVDPTRALTAADALLVASDPAFDPETALPANAVPVGAVLQELPARRAREGRPLVLASLSSTWFPGQQQVLQRVLDALAGLPVDVVCTTGRAVDASTLVAPSNAVVRGFVDHAELLPEVSLLVGHGGQATTVRALAHGVPVLVLPMHPLLDQPMIGRAVARAEVGLTLPKRATVGAIRTAAARLLADDRVRLAADAFGQRLAARDAAGTAADELERLAAAPPGVSRGR